jgi:hypothetical protein
MPEPSMAPVAPSAVSCPPHHWLVIDHAPRVQHWTCYRCGAEHHPAWVAPEDAYASWTQRQRAKHARSRA